MQISGTPLPGYAQNFSTIFAAHLYVYTERHGARVVTLSPPTSEIGARFPALPQVGKLVVACRWSAVYRTEA